MMNSRKILTAVRLDPMLIDAMKILKERDGPSIAWQVDAALRIWLAEKQVLREPPKHASKRA